MADSTIREVEGGVLFGAKIVPGSRQTAICGLLDGMLKIKVSAGPEKGKANKCLVQFLARRLGVKKKAVSIISGQTKSVKQIQVLGISTEALLKEVSLQATSTIRK
ncbi:MAG: DUF167 domain-containing protein [Planctomycetota bacterium]|jgi:uncharacterized protein (TIGR00251 family)